MEPLWGAEWRNLTGRIKQPLRCMEIELGEDVYTHFQYFQSDNSTTSHARYTPKTPYNYNVDDGAMRHPWSAYEEQDKVRVG